jgi:hypothetical protein
MKLVCVSNEIIESAIFGSNKVIKLPLTVGKAYEVIIELETTREPENTVIYTDNMKWEVFENYGAIKDFYSV